MLVNALATLGILLLIWVLYRGVKSNPQAFSGENLNKSFLTIGFLGLALIAIVVFAVFLLRR